ncbi:MAG: type transport system ATP-binding protein [Actinomycetota bacterium]
METAAPVDVVGLTKVYGPQRVVDDLTFSIAPGRVTGFLGPNGAGKTTTLRMVLGLAAATSGDARVFGQRFDQLAEPSRVVGSLLDASGFHPGRRARQELLIHAAAAGIADERVDQVLHEVGLAAAGEKRVAQLSLGMRQRLGLAAALLGEPRLLILDEPANGLDPAGMHWLRELLVAYATKGAAVLVSSHVLAELALFAEDVVVLDHGRLVVESSVAQLIAGGTERVIVRSPQLAALRKLVTRQAAQVTPIDAGLEVVGIAAEDIGALAAEHGIVLHQLRTEIQSLEDIFLDLTSDAGGIR